MGIVTKIKDIWKPVPAPSLGQIVKIHAINFGLDPKLVACIIYQESGGDPDAFRVEERFYDKYLAKKERKDLVGHVPNFPPTLTSEKRARAVSYGVMQILGETARWMGFTGRWLHKCANTEDNVYLGCKYLDYLVRQAKNISGGTEKLKYILTRWNGSSEYPNIIFEHMKNERWRFILD